MADQNAPLTTPPAAPQPPPNPNPQQPNQIPVQVTQASPSAPGCFRVNVRLNSIVYDYDATAPGQITQDQLDLMSQLKKTEAAIKAIFYPDGLPPDLKLRKPAPPNLHPQLHTAPKAAHHHEADAAQKDHHEQAQKDEDEDQAELVAAQTDRKKKKAELKKEKFRAYFYQLVLLATIGLDGPACQPFLARPELADLKNEILSREGGRIKNGYMQELGRNALELGSPALLLLVIRQITLALSPGADLLTNQVFRNVMVFSYAWVGAMVGTFLSYAIRNPVLSFDQLAVPEDDRLNPKMRLTYVGLLTTVFTLALLLQVISLEFGPVKTQGMGGQPSLALLIGVFCGISERALGQKS